LQKPHDILNDARCTSLSSKVSRSKCTCILFSSAAFLQVK